MKMTVRLYHPVTPEAYTEVSTFAPDKIVLSVTNGPNKAITRVDVRELERALEFLNSRK